MNLKLLEHISRIGNQLFLIPAVCLLGFLLLVWPVQGQGPPGLPATYYGRVQAGSDFVPTAGMTVTAHVNGTLCGESQTESKNSEIVYQINVMGAGPDENGCGTAQRAVRLFIESQEMGPMGRWDNSQVHEVDLYPVDTQVIVDPTSSSTLVYTDTEGNPTTLFVPTAAVTQSTTLVYTPLLTATALPPASFSFANHAFTISAFQDGTLLPSFTFAQPSTLTLSYSEADIGALEENSLRLHYWSGSAWEDAATTCTPASLYQREPEANRLSVAICHLTEFGLFGQPTNPTSVRHTDFTASTNTPPLALFAAIALGLITVASTLLLAAKDK